MHSSLLNSPYELGLKAMLILLHEQPRQMSCERIMYYDYFSMYNDDIVRGKNVNSLSALYPYRYAELVSKRKRLADGILYFSAKGLITPCYDKSGIAYKANVNTLWFCKVFEANEYATNYLQALANCSDTLKGMDESEIFLHYRESISRGIKEEILQYFDGGNINEL